MPKIALFPLGNILLPGGLMPIQVFEERYIRLIQDTATRTSIGIIQPESDNNENNPPLSSMGCSGRVIRFEELDNDRFFILLRGERRFHYIEDHVTAGGYRKAEIRWVVETATPDPQQQVIDDRGKFMETLAHYLEEMGVKADFGEIETTQDVQLINTLAMLLPALQREKQALLEANSIEERLQLLKGMVHKGAITRTETKWRH
ncbi:MAG: LON peptidase substrate-binding domain-containing protein [Alphaproteobacteria bacterium]|nr:LON peptidase substrate-binding domain-containing protein [Alphaproteobacteria bacterium]